MALTKMARSSYGVEHDRAEPWEHRAACKGSTVHTSDHLGYRATGYHNEVVLTAPTLEAGHVCLAHCPVRRQCRKQAEALGLTGVVVDGVLLPQAPKGNGRSRTEVVELPDIGHGQHCAHLLAGAS